MSKKLVIIGVGGHGKVILDIALECGYTVTGFIDDYQKAIDLDGYSVIGTTKDIAKYKDDTEFIIAIGSNSIRKRIGEQYDFVNWATLIHPGAIIGMGASIEKGTVVMANAVVNPFAKIGKHNILNTACVIEHDCNLENYVHVSPGAILSGTVLVGEGTHIGAGATIKNNLNICGECTIGAGCVVVKDINESGVYVGVPARKLG